MDIKILVDGHKKMMTDMHRSVNRLNQIAAWNRQSIFSWCDFALEVEWLPTMDVDEEEEESSHQN